MFYTKPLFCIVTYCHLIVNIILQVSQYTFAMCSYREKKPDPTEMMQLDGFTVDYCEPLPGQKLSNETGDTCMTVLYIVVVLKMSLFIPPFCFLKSLCHQNIIEDGWNEIISDC